MAAQHRPSPAIPILRAYGSHAGDRAHVPAGLGSLLRKKARANEIRQPGNLRPERGVPMKRRVLHIINSFEHGGAETMLCNLALRHDTSRWEPMIATLIDDMTVAGPLISAGIKVFNAGMSSGLPDPRGVMRLARYIR